MCVMGHEERINFERNSVHPDLTYIYNERLIKLVRLEFLLQQNRQVPKGVHNCTIDAVSGLS